VIRLKFAIELKYEIADSASDFVFNIHAAQTPWQSVFAEALLVSQPVEASVYTDPTFGSRYMRMTAQPGPLTVRYDATVDISHHLEPPARIFEIPVARLASDLLPGIDPG
jgi:hypothetical protein